MPAPKNSFKAALREGRPQIGLWVALANPYSAEICAGAGFDWLLIDGEHAPNDIPLILGQLQAVSGSPSHPVVRVPIGEPWIIKQVLDIGAQTILVPMVESADQAESLVRAVRYPPQGTRGVGAALARASAFNRIKDYLPTANGEICLLVQVESRRGLDAVEAISAVDGVDGVFIGPSDLAADMGYIGEPGAPEVRQVIENGIRLIRSKGKAAGVLTSDLALAHGYLEFGTTFVAIGTDVGLLNAALNRVLSDFNGEPPGASAPHAVY